MKKKPPGTEKLHRLQSDNPLTARPTLAQQARAGRRYTLDRHLNVVWFEVLR